MSSSIPTLDSLDPPIEIETGPGPQAAIIWLHGLGADGHDFEPIVPELELPHGDPVRFVFPHAPYRPVTINGGYVMRAWYDLGIGERGLWQDAGHIRESEGIVRELIAREQQRGVPSARIVLAGFSQGGVVVLHAGLRHTERLAGILALSAPLVDGPELMRAVAPANAATPVFLAHGTQDTIAPYAMGEQTRATLQGRGLPVEWHTYPMPHSVCPAEISDMGRWLRQVPGFLVS